MKAKLFLYIITLVLLSLLQVACSGSGAGGTTTGNPPREDDSSSGTVAASVGGALSNSSSTSTLSKPQSTMSLAQASASSSSSSICPTFRSTAGSGCTQSAGSLWLDYNGCTFNAGQATLTGTQSLIMSSGSATCGVFPHPGANGILYRQFVSGPGSTTPSTLIVRSFAGVLGGIDDHTTDLGNFDNQTLAPIHNGGYGSAVSFNASGARSGLTLGQRVAVVGVYDHSVSGSLTVSENPGDTNRGISGSITVFHNGLKVIGTSTFHNVVHKDICCVPISGSISTAFTAGTSVSPSTLGALMVGHSEILTFTGCGTATYQHYDGTLENVSLTRCY